MRKKTNKGRNVKGSSERRTSSTNRKSYRKDDSKEVDSKAVANSGNDPAWYGADPAILRDAASYPFSWPSGASETHNSSLYDNTHIVPYSKVPGICSLRITPSIGYCMRATDPVNVAAQSVYSFVRHANSGHSNYDAPDLMLYILAMAQNYSFLVWCQRLYGYALTYDQRNRYLPNELIRLNNVDADDLRNNLANFRFWINTLIAKMASFAVPATYSIFSRMSFMYSDFYVEGTSIKEQLYQFVPEGFYKFDLDTNQAGMLKWTPFNYGTLMTVSDIITYGNSLFGAIWDQEDFGIMSGDILKAYGDRIIKLAAIPEYYNIAPKFDAMVLTQMKNATIIDTTVDDIKQASGIILCSLTPRSASTSDKYFGTANALSASWATTVTGLRGRYLRDYKALTVDTDNPTPEVVMEASRLMYGFENDIADLKLGTDYVSHIVVTYDINSDYIFQEFNCYTYSDMANIKAVLNAMQTIKHFHYLPRIPWFGENNSVWQVYEWFDLDNFAILNNQDIAKLHAAAVINMYAVPSVGKVM